MVAEVVAVESDPALAALAREALSATPKVRLVQGPLEAGDPTGAPYDVLVIDGSVEHVPEGLLAQVAAGGRIVTGLAEGAITRLAAGRKSEGGYGLFDFADIDCVPLPGFARPKSFTF